MKRYKMKHRAVICKLGALKRKYYQMQKTQMNEMYKEALLEEMKMRIEALEYILN